MMRSMEPSQRRDHNHKEDEEQEHAQYQREEEEEDDIEEALSLRDLPLKADQTSAHATAAVSVADHHDPAAELFEFISSAAWDVSPAENIIFCGKLIPLNDQNTLLRLCHDSDNNNNNDKASTNTSPRRSESLSALQGDKLSHSSSVPRVTRKLTCATSNEKFSPTEQDHEFSEKGSSKTMPKSDASASKTSETASFGGKSVRPRWYVIMFGMVKFPPEFELRDIKIRQIRRNSPPVMFPSPNDRRSGKSPPSSWRFLKALSCKEPTSVAATAPFWMPHAA